MCRGAFDLYSLYLNKYASFRPLVSFGHSIKGMLASKDANKPNIFANRPHLVCSQWLSPNACCDNVILIWISTFLKIQ